MTDTDPRFTVTPFRRNGDADRDPDYSDYVGSLGDFDENGRKREVEQVRFKSAAQFCSEYQPLAYVVDPIIRTSSVYTVTAKTGAGKTALAVILCLGVVTGRSDIVGMEVERGRVAYLAFENPDDVRMRLMTAAYLLNVDLPELQNSYTVLDARTKPEDLVTQLRREAVDGAFSLVVLDTFAAGFDGRDINDNVEAGEFVRRLRPITQVEGLPALVIAAHPVKNAADDNLVPYGGGAILNEVDGNLTLSKKADTGSIALHWQGKFRGLEFSPAHFRLEIVGSPDVVDKKGRTVLLPVMRPVAAERADEQAVAEADRTIIILRAIDTNPDMKTVRDLEIATGISKSSVDRHLKRLRCEKLIEQDLRMRWRLTKTGAEKFKEISD